MLIVVGEYLEGGKLAESGKSGSGNWYISTYLLEVTNITTAHYLPNYVKGT